MCISNGMIIQSGGIEMYCGASVLSAIWLLMCYLSYLLKYYYAVASADEERHGEETGWRGAKSKRGR